MCVDILSEELKPVLISCNLNIYKMAYKDPMREICWFCNAELGKSKKQEKIIRKDSSIRLWIKKERQEKFLQGYMQELWEIQPQSN